MSTGLTKGRIQEILKNADNRGTLNSNRLVDILASIGITSLPRGMSISNSNDRDTIISALRKFMELKIGSRRSDEIINPKSIINYEKKRSNTASRKRSVTPGSIRYPWILLNLDSGVPIVTKVLVPGYSSPKGWSIDWVRNVPLQAFPLSKIEEVFNSATSSNAKVRSQTVGKVCSADYRVLNSRCGTPSSTGSWAGKNVRNRYAYIYEQPARSYNTYKNGISGLSVDQLAKIIIRIGKTNASNRPKARADFLELKRNGDYGEVFTIYTLNSNNNNFIMKPGDIRLAQTIVDNRGNIPPGFDNYEDNNFYYTNGCFWSTDRPALFLCVLLNVPFIRVSGREYHFNLESPLDTLMNVYGGNIMNIPAIREFNRADVDIVQQIINNRLTQTNFNSPWFLKMCVIDTAHDFGNDSARSKMATSRQQRTMLKDIMIGMGIRRGANVPSGSWKNFVDSVWSAKRIENIMGTIVNAISTQTTKSEQESLQSSGSNSKNILQILDTKDMCIVWDSGSSPPGELIKRTALAAAKFLDPAS